MDRKKYFEKLQKQRATLLIYMQSKVDSEDFHGVVDAAMDLREVDSKLELLREMMQGE